jgi:hypothetical protein
MSGVSMGGGHFSLSDTLHLSKRALLSMKLPRFGTIWGWQ